MPVRPLRRPFLPIHTLEPDKAWRHREARTIGQEGSAYVSFDPAGVPLPDKPVIRIRKESFPRQGINTGGRNDLFIFRNSRNIGKELREVSNKNVTALLPEKLLYPLITKNQFRRNSDPDTCIFLPYRMDGGLMTEDELKAYPEAWAYLKEQKPLLESRKGVLLRSQINKGRYWALMGIGPYTFLPWKIVWESYGRHEFLPKLFFPGRRPYLDSQSGSSGILCLHGEKGSRAGTERAAKPSDQRSASEPEYAGNLQLGTTGPDQGFFRKYRIRRNRRSMRKTEAVHLLY